MVDKQSEEWRNLTFSQRTGKAPLPEALQAGEVNQKFRNRIWLAFDQNISKFIARDRLGDRIFVSNPRHWLLLFYKYHLDVLCKPHDDVSQQLTPDTLKRWLRNIIIEEESHEVLTLVEYFFRAADIPESLAVEIENCFEFAPYSIDRSSEPVCIFPTTSEEMKENVERSLDNINNSELTGAKTHLRNSSQELNNKNYADSIRESINAVASAARQIDPDDSRDLGPALDSLERSGIIKHRALKEAFKKLYGYTSDEQGIRKPLIEQESADVGFDEAIFMYGACVSFVDYLSSKQRQLRK